MRYMLTALLAIGSVHGATLNYAFQNTTQAAYPALGLTAYSFIGTTGSADFLPGTSGSIEAGTVVITVDPQNVGTTFATLFPISYTLDGATQQSGVFATLARVNGQWQYAGMFFVRGSIDPHTPWAYSSTVSGIADGVTANPINVAVTLDPTVVPEPSTWAFSGVALIGLALPAFRRRSSRSCR